MKKSVSLCRIVYQLLNVNPRVANSGRLGRLKAATHLSLDVLAGQNKFRFLCGIRWMPFHFKTYVWTHITVVHIVTIKLDYDEITLCINKNAI